MRRRGPASLVLVMAGALAACQASASPEASSSPPAASSVPPAASTSAAPTASTSTPADSPGSVPASPDAGGAIDPEWVTRPALTCGDPHPLFAPEALEGFGLAELGLDLAAAVLRSTIADTPDYFPDSGWHRVADTGDGVMFVAPGNAETPWFEITVGPFDGTLQATAMGQCTLAIAAPDGVSFARWWLDPDAPPPTEESTRLAILLREQDCASGKPPVGRVLPPTIVPGADAILVAIAIRGLANADCPANPAHPVQLVLPELLGARQLFDASVYPPRPVTTEDPG